MMLFSKCYHGGLQHRFEPRITEERIPPDVSRLGKFEGTHADMEMMLKAGTKVIETYHGDVCVWCGLIVNSPKVKT